MRENMNVPADQAPQTTAKPKLQKTTANGASPYRMEMVTVTPKMAREWLQTNTENRPLSPKLLRAYAEDMRKGLWQVNGEPLIFADTGRLMNGQHRLHACIEAEMPFQTFVTHGVAEDVFKTLDTGRKRQASDMLAILGSQHHMVTAAAARLIMVYDCLIYKPTSDRQMTASNEEVIAFYTAHPQLEASAAAIVGYGVALRRVMSPTILTVLHFGAVTGGHPADGKLDEFMHRLMDGADLAVGNPILSLRSRILKEKMDGKRTHQVDMLVWCIRAFNAYVKDRNLARVLGPIPGTNPFPPMVTFDQIGQSAE